MFKTGDFIIYGNNGVCKVEEVGKLDSALAQNDRLYYTLSPYYAKGSTIFTPVDNKKVIMRPVISRKDAMELIDGMEEIETLFIGEEKSREQEYRGAFQTCECKELVKIIKTIYLRKQSRTASGKKVTMGDEKYFHMAEDNLYGELAVSLGMTKDEVREFIVSRVGDRADGCMAEPVKLS